MKPELVFTHESEEILDGLSKDSSKKRILKDVLKTLAFMEIDLRHPSLNTHEYKTFKGPNGRFLKLMLNKRHLAPTESFGIMVQVKTRYQLLPFSLIQNRWLQLIK